jgi:hypothetical protein
VRQLALGLALALLAGCPQERPGAERQIPGERVPPAVSLDPPAGDAGAAIPTSPPPLLPAPPAAPGADGPAQGKAPAPDAKGPAPADAGARR